MSNYHNDQPITGSESKPDQLNREKFAAHLAEILTLSPEDDCLTISLEGEWGYGKTSVVNLVKKAAAAQDNKPILIEYNPWLPEIAVNPIVAKFFASHLKILNHKKLGNS